MLLLTHTARQILHRDNEKIPPAAPGTVGDKAVIEPAQRAVQPRVSFCKILRLRRWCDHRQALDGQAGKFLPKPFQNFFGREVINREIQAFQMGPCPLLAKATEGQLRMPAKYLCHLPQANRRHKHPGDRTSRAQYLWKFRNDRRKIGNTVQPSQV